MSIQLKDQIRHHYQAVDTSQDAVDWLEIVERVEMPVVPGPGLPPPRHKIPFIRRPVVIAAMAFAAVILAALPFLLQDPDDEVVSSTVPTPTTIVTPTTTPDAVTTIPEAVTPEPPPSGVVTWTEVNGAILPGEAFSFPAGASPFTGLGILVRKDNTDLSIWNSVNGVDWADTGTSLPVSSRWNTIETTPSGYWLMGEEPALLWYSPDAQPGTWEEIDVGQFAREAPPGLKWEQNILRPARVGEVVMVPVEYRLDLDWEEILGLEPGVYSPIDFGFRDESVADEPTDVMVVNGDTESGEVTLARLLPQESADGVRLIDEGTGEEVYFLPRGTEGLDGEMLAELGGWRTYSLFFLTSDGVVATDLWTGEPGTPGSAGALQVYEFEDSVIALAAVGEGIESFITSDGINFVSHPSPSFEWSTIRNDPYSGYLYASVGFFFPPTHWMSADSVNWSLLDVDASLPSTLHRLDGAWVVLRYAEEGGLSDTHYISVDYETWQPLTGLPTDFMPIREPIAWGDKILLVGEKTSWLGSLELIR